MLNEWTDRMTAQEAEALWQRRVDDEVARRVAKVEAELRESMKQSNALPVGFYDAMRHFLTLREKLFPGLSADPAWKILVALARTPDGSDKSSVTGIIYDAGVPMATALRYIAALEIEGVIERVPDPEDKRRTWLRLTKNGRARLDAIAERWARRILLAISGSAAAVIGARAAYAALTGS